MKWTEENIPGMDGKVVIITGGNSGIGFETAKALALKGANIVIASRSAGKAEKAKETILQSIPGARIEILQLDLADLNSVKEFVSKFQKRYSRIDILFNNAGIMSVPYGLTKDGFEDHIGTNHLGHFALTGLLIETITGTKDSRIVNISSVAHKFGRIDFGNLNYEGGKNYSRMDAYSRSKLANLYFTFGLQEYFRKNRHSTIAVAAHPGITDSNIARHMLGPFLFKILKPFITLVLQKTSKGALPQIRAAVDPDVKGGEYYGPGGRMEWAGYPVAVEPSDMAKNEDNVRKLWEISEQLTGVRFP